MDDVLDDYANDSIEVINDEASEKNTSTEDFIEIIEDVAVVKKATSVEELSDISLSTLHEKRSRKITYAESIQEEESIEAQVKKRVRRDPLVVAQEKLQKAEEQAEKKRQREEIKLAKENEKKRRKIEREAVSANKSKSEQYTYCHVGSEFKKLQGLESAVVSVFSERNLKEQLIFDDSLDVCVHFQRKQVEVMEVDNSIDKLEYMCLQHIFGVLVEADAFRNLVQSNTLEDFVSVQQSNYAIPNSQLIIICFGDHKLPAKKIMDTSLTLFDENRAHIEFFTSTADLALFLAQTVRALAKKVSSRPNKLIVDIEKGITDGTHDEIVKDWWDKMLTALERLGGAQRRAIVRHIPDPLIAIQDFRAKGYDVVTKELANLICENGRRLGPAMAHRLFIMLTDTTGNPVID